MNLRAEQRKAGLISASLVLLAVILLYLAASAFSPVSASADFKASAAFPIPYPNAKPQSIVLETPGTVWFTMPGVNALGRLVVTNAAVYSFSRFNLPSAGSKPYDLVIDGSYIWITEHVGNRIAKFELSSEQFVSEYDIPTSDSRPTGITIDGSGFIWFAEKNANKIGRIDPNSQSNAVIEYSDPAIDALGSALYESIDVSRSGRIWVTAPGINRVVDYDPDRESFNVRPVGAGPSQPTFPPYGISLGGTNQPFISAPSEGWIGVLISGTFAFWRWYEIYDYRRTTPDPTEIIFRTREDHSELWYIESIAKRIGFMVFNDQGDLIETWNSKVSNGAKLLKGFVVGDDDLAWITDQEGNQIITWTIPDLDKYLYSPIWIVR